MDRFSHLAKVKGIQQLLELAFDLHGYWNHARDGIWRELDAELWEQSHNPLVVLQTISKTRLQSALKKKAYRMQIKKLIKAKHQITKASAWFQRAHPKAPLRGIAYFCMEYMLSEALPIYSGGLGNVAGDLLKTANDLGLPLVGIGLLYQQGYSRQKIDATGWQQTLYPHNDPSQLPIMPCRDANGDWLRLKLNVSGRAIWLRVWQVQVGRVWLYLLDSNDLANAPLERQITGSLYGGNQELRLQQEIILGIGGVQLLNQLGLPIDVYHLNEGHTAFAVLERARQYMQKNHCSFELALCTTRAGNLFTTHTAVSAGFDRFDAKLIEHYLSSYIKDELKLSLNDFLALGRQSPQDETESFNMAYLAIHGSIAVNGVSRLHEKVSQDLFAPLFPHWPLEEIPVGHVNNGVHMPSWDSASADTLWTKSCGQERWLGSLDNLSKKIATLTDASLWQFRMDANQALIDYVYQQLTRADDLIEQKPKLDPHTLTLGFARRFVSYKRPNLLLHDPERLLKIINNPHYPVQLLIAGKAHPKDEAGHQLVQAWINFIQRTACTRVVFLTDYDLRMAEQLVQGVDVWLNTPRRPWEASGTSGMKVLVNGGLNFSTHDGWWEEAYDPALGWALTDKICDSESKQDALDAEELYTILEKEIIPCFYERNEQNLPAGWIQKMRNSMAELTPRYSSNRMLREYTEKFYLPLAAGYHARAKNNMAKTLLQRQQDLQQQWLKLRFDKVDITNHDEQYQIDAHVSLVDINPQEIVVELFANGLEKNKPERHALQGKKQEDGWHYQISLALTRPVEDYTLRIVPNADILGMVPLEVNCILWQR